MRQGQIVQQRWPAEAPTRIFEQTATFSIGSGNHARSFLHAAPNGTLTQLPLTWYTQEKAWAMSPGYDRPAHAGFSRQIAYLLALDRECEPGLMPVVAYWRTISA